MGSSKYSKFLTIILVIGIVAILLLVGFLGYDWYKNYFESKDASEYVDNFANNPQIDTSIGNESLDYDYEFESSLPALDLSTNSSNTGSSSTTPQYQGYDVLGTMEIPATNFKYPVLATVSNKSLEISVGYLYGPGLNQEGNTVILGHNYRNGLFFSNNKKLQLGDKIYVTDNSGNKVTYTITQKFETASNDTSFYVQETQGKAMITLSTCTDDSSARLIIIAESN